MTDEKRKFIEVDHERFEAHVSKYQPNVHTNVSHTSDPPLKQYWDTTKEPEDPLALIGAVWLYETYPKDRAGQTYGWAPNKHLIPPS